MHFDILISLSCGGAGLVCGWILHALQKAQGRQSPSLALTPELLASGQTEFARSKTPKKEANAAPKIPVEKVSAVADRVRMFAQLLAEDVDAHQVQVEEVNSQLEASDLSNSPPVIVHAVEQLLAANEHMRGQLEQSKERLREQSKELETAQQRARTDALTQIPNRGAFDDVIEKQHSLGADSAGFLAVLDIDLFKQFNDQFGHRAGDEVLRSVAASLDARLSRHGMVARFGGEEFAALIQCETLSEAVELIEATRLAISKREVHFEGQRLKVTASVGISGLREGEPEHVWLQRADDALYRSKETGRNRTHYAKGTEFILVGKDRPPATWNTSQTVSPNEQDSQTNAPATTDSPCDEENTSTTAFIDATDSPSVVCKESEILEALSELSQLKRTAPPKSLNYLPDREMMMDSIADMLRERLVGEHMHTLMAVTLSGSPSGATMRSLLQLVRAALRSQDKIGCIDQSTLLIGLPNCQPSEAAQRAESLCISMASIGIQLASAQKSQSGERVSIGLTLLDAQEDGEFDALREHADQAIRRTQAIAILAAQDSGRWPIKVSSMPTTDMLVAT